MKRNNLFNIVFLISFLLIMLIVLLRILHVSIPFANVLVGLGIVLTVIYVIIALVEIWSSQRPTFSEKLMWTVGFIAFNIITGILYLLIGRPRILRDYKILHL